MTTAPAREMYDLASELFPICRSITGEGFRRSMEILRGLVPEIEVHEVPSGTRVFDWEIPMEWNIRDAYIITPSGEKICDFKKSNLHVLGYSTAVDKTLPLEELQQHLYSLPEQPDAIPYVTSYYRQRWGFCLRHSEREKLEEGDYRVFIDSDLEPGSLTYGELILKGETEEEVFLSTYLCHPSMANNELSGPVVATYIARWLSRLPKRKYTYRMVFIPETIGSITYLSRNYLEMKGSVIAGFNLTCMGDDRAYSFLPSRSGDTLADRVALHVLGHLERDFIKYSYLDRGSDERQYCSPGIDLPVCSLMRSKYGTYPEYHTSLDNLELISPEGLGGGYELIEKAIRTLEACELLRTKVLCEPHLSKHGLYPTISSKESGLEVRDMMNLLAYADGNHDTLEIAEKIGVPLWRLASTIETLKSREILVPSPKAPGKHRKSETLAPLLDNL